MRKRILVVTHDLTLLTTRSSLLLKAGYAVDSAASGDAALELLQKQNFDLVVVGCNSQGLNKQID